MPEFKHLYRYSFKEAQNLKECDKWRESFEENKRCRDFIDDLICQNFDGLYIKGEIPQKTVAEFGFDRTQWVLANHIQLHNQDGRFNSANKAWASNIYIQRPEKWELEKDSHLHDHNKSLLLNSHSELVDYIAGQVQNMYLELNLYDHRHIIKNESDGDYTGKILILKDISLNENHRTPENQLFFAQSGFGCSQTASGRAVIGQFLIDGEKTRLDHSDFLGIVDEQYLPDWAKEKLIELQTADTPEEEQPGMKGI